METNGGIGEAAASPATSMTRPRIAVIGTGGTFAMHARHRFDWVEYADSGIVHPIDALLETMGELAPDVDLVPVPFRSLGSVAITPDDWLALAQLIARYAAQDPGITGFVVTHGTATLEETAWFLDLVLALPQPVVLTGAQRPANTAGSDAPGNLRAAIATACAPQARHSGVLVVMDGWVFTARDVTKAASFELQAFEAPPFGPVARIEADAGIAWRRQAPRRMRDAGTGAGRSREHDIDLSVILHAATPVSFPRVDIVLSYAGADSVAIDAYVAAGARAIIGAGLAPGRPSAGEWPAYRAAVAAGVVVVQSSRAARGTVPPQRFLQEAGILAGGDLSPQKLRIAMMLVLQCRALRGAASEWDPAEKAAIQGWLLTL